MHLLPFEKKERRILVKNKSETDKSFGCPPEERKTQDIISYGIVNINKPQGPTSHQVAEYTKRILGISKAGHSGTLDPNVHGILPVALGRATRVAYALLNSGKEYVGIMHMHKDIDETALNEAIKKHFLGKIRQTPPLKSAVKRQERTREIYYFDILEKDEKDVLFIVGCQAGTYIRKLIHDLGIKLKAGAHMQELRRTKAGPFNESTAFSLHDLADAFHYYKNEKNDKFLRRMIQPVENAISHLPKMWVHDNAIDTMCHGAYLNLPGISKLNDGIRKHDFVAVMTLKEELVALGIAQLNSAEMLEKEKGLALKTDMVFMEPGIYKTGKSI